MDEVDVHAVDLGDELRQPVQPRFTAAPVVARRPIARQLLHGLKLNPLRCIRDELAIGPSGGEYAPSEIRERLVREVDLERANVAVWRRRMERGRAGYRRGAESHGD